MRGSNPGVNKPLGATHKLMFTMRSKSTRLLPPEGIAKVVGCGEVRTASLMFVNHCKLLLMRFAPLTASYAITNFIAYSKRVTYRFKNTMEYLTQILAHD
jgi:hypothetical protein